ncbi:hypothetical protein PT279_07860 [Bifidobacterium sp. ESL0784]|uniref:SIR2 family NAD-dependent protein deacylase n=1 Tax=Bifidobacterium sp. ESL0784 TaxID=2983231 RepID=UPI0023F799B2|nr:hypothetical protein [Bifidobacterium sp. ESL0784]
MRESRHVAAFTGAGASADAGIPDLAGINRILRAEGFHGGVFGMLDPAFVRRDPGTFYRLYRQTFLKPNVRPDAAHRFLARLEREGRLDGVATMNIDCLHQQAGGRHVCEYWGDMRLNHCAACGRACDWGRDTGTGIHHCSSCGGTVVPDFITRRLATYPEQVAAGRRLIAGCDLLIVIGTQTIPTPPHGTPVVHVDLKPHPPAPGLIRIQGRADDVFTKLDAIYQS